MTTTEILTGIKNWVLSKLSLKQDVINDLAAIRSGSQAGSTAVQPSDLSSYFNNASYDTNTHRINFYHGQNIVAYVDASPFIVDGMVNDVRIENGYLVIDFNTDSGKQDISIPLTDIFDPSNYYNKTQTDGLLVQKQDVIQDLSDIRSGAQSGSKAYQKPQAGIPSTDMSQDVQTSLEKANTALQEHQSLDAYAKNDGYYEGMGVGTADNLTGQTERTDDAMYRKSGGSEEVASGTATIANIKGKTVAWNQKAPLITQNNYIVYNSSGCSRTIVDGVADVIVNNYTLTGSGIGIKYSYLIPAIIGHMYYYSTYIKTSKQMDFGVEIYSWPSILANIPADNKFHKSRIISGVNRSFTTLLLSPRSTFDETSNTYSVKNNIFIDLTLIYGAGNEPTTSEQFEADYFKWFGKPLSYEEYDAGSLRSVQLDSLKTTGFNQYNNGNAKVIGGLQYQITGTYTSITLNDEAITPDANGLFTPSTSGTLTIVGGGSDTCVHISGDRNNEYEPYEEHSVSLPVTTITGKLDGKGESVVVFPDGMKSAGSAYDEIYTVGDKTYAVKRIYSVNLGTLNWEISATSGMEYRMKSYVSNYGIKGNSNVNYVPNLICAKYQTISPLETEQSIGISYFGYSKNIFLGQNSYTDPSAFKTAMSGVMLYYELYTPEVYELDTFDLPKPYQVDANGTEEQIQKSGVQGLAAILTILYGVDAVKILDKLPQNYISEKSMDNFLAQLSAVTGGVWTKTWNDNTGEWDFSFTPNAQTDDTNVEETNDTNVEETI